MPRIKPNRTKSTAAPTEPAAPAPAADENPAVAGSKALAERRQQAEQADAAEQAEAARMQAEAARMAEELKAHREQPAEDKAAAVAAHTEAIDGPEPERTSALALDIGGGLAMPAEVAALFDALDDAPAEEDEPADALPFNPSFTYLDFFTRRKTKATEIEMALGEVNQGDAVLASAQGYHPTGGKYLRLPRGWRVILMREVTFWGRYSFEDQTFTQAHWFEPEGNDKLPRDSEQKVRQTTLALVLLLTGKRAAGGDQVVPLVVNLDGARSRFLGDAIKGCRDALKADWPSRSPIHQMAVQAVNKPRLRVVTSVETSYETPKSGKTQPYVLAVGTPKPINLQTDLPPLNAWFAAGSFGYLECNEKFEELYAQVFDLAGDYDEAKAAHEANAPDF